MVAHRTLRVNYTTYDVRRAQDSLNPRTHADVMVLSQEDQDDSDGHPYWYARLLGIFHVDVQHVGAHSADSTTQRMEFAWVRWLGADPGHKDGWEAKRLRRIGFVPGEDGFGFIDPLDIIRAVHLIPAFAHGRTTKLLPPSAVRQHAFIKDWKPRVSGRPAPTGDSDTPMDVSEDAWEDLTGEEEHLYFNVFDEDEDWHFFYVNQ